MQKTSAPEDREFCGTNDQTAYTVAECTHQQLAEEYCLCSDLKLFLMKCCYQQVADLLKNTGFADPDFLVNTAFPKANIY